MALFTATEVKIIGITVAAVTVVAVLVTVSVGLAKRPREELRQEPGSITGRSMPDISEIIVPEEFTLTGGERWYFSRDPLKKWNAEQIDEYWIDPAEIGIDLMVEKTDRSVEEFFEGIP